MSPFEEAAAANGATPGVGGIGFRPRFFFIDLFPGLTH
jgi:hypothetical protein